MNFLFIIHDSPYGNERPYNGLRLAMSHLRENTGVNIWIFLTGDAVVCASSNQSTPNGFYNIEQMLTFIMKKGGQVKTCGSCTEARGLSQATLIDGIEKSNLKQLTEWSLEADKIITF